MIIIKCPNCGEEMKCECGNGHDVNFGGTSEVLEKHTCSSCKITYDGSNWTIPDDKLPTDKQKNTILFINNRLNMDLKALTKRQCWLDTNQYFDEAKKTVRSKRITRAKRTHIYPIEYFEEMQDFFGWCPGDFC